MLRAISFFTLVSCVFAGTLHLTDNGLDGRIINGEATTIQQHPYQVSVQARTLLLLNQHICGGSLLSADIVLTAAHCVKPLSIQDLSVYLGSTYHDSGGQRIQILEAKVHEDYDEYTNEHDIALIKLNKKFNKSTTTDFIPLALETPTSNTAAVASGWGLTCYNRCPLSRVLQKVDVNTITMSECNSSPYKYNGAIKAGMFCALGVKKDSCQGDSGGPLVSEGKLIGVISWGIDCAKAAYPGVYADVAYYRNWILKNMNSL